MSVIWRRAWISLVGSLCLAVTLSSCGTLPASTVDKRRDPVAVDTGAVRSLQRQIKEQEKRIAELEAQLDALKMIDQDYG
jgi:septal ring factor EnvC (AmiA/AmiB activator)